MAQSSRSQSVPAWVRPGARWVQWVGWPLLCLSVLVLGVRIAVGDRAGSIAVAAFQVLLWAFLLMRNRSARRKGRDSP